VALPGRQVSLALAVAFVVALALAALALVPASAPGAGGPVDYPLCTADGAQTYPAAHGDRVVWVDYRSDPDGDIWMYDYATGEETQVTDNEYEQSDPDIWGDWVVYYDCRNSNGDIYATNVATGEELAICTDPAPQQRPKICDDLIVWEDLRGGGWDVYYYYISSGAVTGWTYGEDRSPDVYHDGEDYILAWDAGGELVVVNNDTSESRILTVGLYGATLVAGDGEFVWGSFEDREATGTPRLYLYRYGWSDTAPVEMPTDHEPYAEFRSLSVSGTKVAYAWDSPEGFRVRVADWAAPTETRVTTNESGQYSPTIAGDMVVWRDDRNYTGTGSAAGSRSV
jgi:beta propeller repeat protein